MSRFRRKNPASLLIKLQNPTLTEIKSGNAAVTPLQSGARNVTLTECVRIYTYYYFCSNCRLYKSFNLNVTQLRKLNDHF